MREELEKMAAIGRLVKKDQFPSSTVEESVPRRADRTVAYPHISTSNPNPEPKTPEGGPEWGRQQ